MSAEIDLCPYCGSLPCDQTDTPASAAKGEGDTPTGSAPERPLARCMGPWPTCGHPRNTCTATPAYQAALIAKRPTGSAPDQQGQGSFAALIPSAQTVKPAPYAFEFISSHKGGQHTNGPDYGVVRVTDMDGNAVEVRTRPRRVGHQARELAISLLDLLNEEPR